MEHINWQLTMDDGNHEDYCYDQIFCRRDIPRRMNWGQRANALASMKLQLLHLSLVFILIFMINQTLLLMYQVRRYRFVDSAPQSNMLHRIILNYELLLTFSCHELDILIQEDDGFLNLWQQDIIPYANRPPINWTIDFFIKIGCLGIHAI
jgi:hypothetical protein